AAAGPCSGADRSLETPTTAMPPEGPAYRGRPLAALLASRVGFEAVAELLWTGALAAAPLRWEPGPEPDLAPVIACLPPEAPHAACLPLLVPARAAPGPARFDVRREAVLPRARSLLRLLAAGLALPRAPSRARRAWRAATLAQAVARAFGVEPAPGRLAAIDALLVVFADHELNASTFAARVAASTQADLYAVVQAGLAALSGPLHGAASDRFEALVAEAALAGSAELALAERQRRRGPVPGLRHPAYAAA